MVFGTNRGWVTGPRAGDRLRLIRIRIGLGLRPLDHGLHGNGGLAGGGVHIEVLEEDLRSTCAQDTFGGFVVGLDVDGGIGGFFNSLDMGVNVIWYKDDTELPDMILGLSSSYDSKQDDTVAEN